MAKKKKSIEYSHEQVLFNIDTQEYKLIRFHPDTMSVDVKVINDATKKGVLNIGFTELPRAIKQKLKPQK